ncbi:MAG: uncharacterized protein A8A55_3022 [Amphiamblys sp. WSBS2006]|nr:MAG: uncharacterized protein A8A55_3022 [Amphiamblys sp. WSBS2006]
MKLVLFVSVFLGYVAAVEDVSGVSGDAGGKEEDQFAVSFKEKGPSSPVGRQEGTRGAALSAGLHGGALPEQDEVFRSAEDEDKTFDMLKEIKGGMWNGRKLEKIGPNRGWFKKKGAHIFSFEKGDDADEGADVFFKFLEISGRNKTIIKDGEFDLGKIKHLILVSNAVQLLPALKIHKDNKMFRMNLTCGTLLSELGDDLLTRKKRVSIGSVKHIHLGGCAINLLTVIETKEGNEIETLIIAEGSLNTIKPLMENEEDIYLGKIKELGFIDTNSEADRLFLKDKAEYKKRVRATFK